MNTEEVLIKLMERVGNLELQAEKNNIRVTRMAEDIIANNTDMKEIKSHIHNVEKRLDDLNSQLLSEMIKINQSINASLGSLDEKADNRHIAFKDDISTFKLEVKNDIASVKEVSNIAALKGTAALVFMMGLFTVMSPGIYNMISQHFQQSNQVQQQQNKKP